jgi:hypothetical protein
MEVGQGPNWGCSAKGGKKPVTCWSLVEYKNRKETFNTSVRYNAMAQEQKTIFIHEHQKYTFNIAPSSFRISILALVSE